MPRTDNLARHDDPCGGGTIIATAIKTKAGGKFVARLGDSITSHGNGPHAGAVMVEASATVFVEGIAVCRVGDKASCGHSITVGSINVFAGG